MRLEYAMARLAVIILTLTLAADVSRADDVGASFTDVAVAAGISVRSSGYAGPSWGDFNGDGHDDLYLSYVKRLYVNDGKGKFTDVTDQVGLGNSKSHNGGCWADFDNDGHLDLFVAPSTLLRNDAGKRFVPMQYDKLHAYFTESGSWADYDGDGFVDLAVAPLYPRDKDWAPAPVYLLRNLGGKSLEDVSKSAGMPGAVCVNRTPAWCDYDNDGDSDLYIARYWVYPDALMRNEGNGQFVDVAPTSGLPYRKAQGGVNEHTLGVAWVDFDRDGFFDVYTCPQHKPNSLYRNNGQGAEKIFTKMPAKSNSGASHGGANEHLSCAWGDFDNDGYPDVYATREPEGGARNVLLRNKGDGTFVDVTTAVGLPKWMGHGAAWADYDGDGDIDLAARGWNPGFKLFRNDLKNDNHWIQFKLIGGEGCNRAAIGARVTVTTGDFKQVQDVDGGSGSMSQNSLVLHFGLGKHETIDAVHVRWPTMQKQSQRFEKLKAGKRYVIVQGKEL